MSIVVGMAQTVAEGPSESRLFEPRGDRHRQASRAAPNRLERVGEPVVPCATPSRRGGRRRPADRFTEPQSPS